jgi:hypothetical protein
MCVRILASGERKQLTFGDKNMSFRDALVDAAKAAYLRYLIPNLRNQIGIPCQSLSPDDDAR